MVIDFFGGPKGQKEFKKKTSLGWNTSTVFFGGRILYWKRNVAQKNVFVEILYFTLHTQTTYQRWRMVFGFRTAPQLLPIFCVAPPNCQLLPGIQFLGCSATFQGSPCLPVELSWFMNFITHWSHEPCQICHKLFILVKNHVSKKSEICVFFMTWMIELWWIIECVGESKRHIPPPRS